MKKVRNVSYRPMNPLEEKLNNGPGYISSTDMEPDSDDANGPMAYRPPAEAPHATPEEAGAHLTKTLQAHAKAKGTKRSMRDAMKGK